MDFSEKQGSQSLDIVGECTCSNSTNDNINLCEDYNDNTAFESEFECRSDCLDADGKIIITDQNVGAVLRNCVLVRRRTKTILQRCLEHLHSASNEIIVPNIFVTFVSVCEDESMIHLIEPLSKYIVKHIDRYVDDEEFLEASHHTLKILFSHGHSEYSSEKDKFRAFTLLTRWVSHNYDERKLCFNELLKIINITKLSPNYHHVEPMNHLDVHEKSPTKTDILSNNELTKDKMEALHVFAVHSVQYIENNMYKVKKAMKVFSRKSTKWVLTDDVYCPNIHTMRNVVIHDKLYRLTETDKRSCLSFSVGRSAQSILDRYLDPPPFRHEFDMCGLRNSIYVHGGADNSCVNKSEEGVQLGICGYNCELDVWCSVSAKNYTAVQRGCLTTDQDRRLYLIGNEKEYTYVTQNCRVEKSQNSFPSLAQSYDLRVEEWQNLSNLSSISKVKACVMHQGKLYVLGSDLDSVGYFEVYDTIAGKWNHDLKRVIPKRASPIKGRIVLENDKLCFFGYSDQYYDFELIMSFCYDLNLSKLYSSPSLSSAILKDYPEISLKNVRILDTVVF